MADKIRGRLIDLSLGMNGRQRITLEIDADFQDDYASLAESDLDIEIKKHREHRTVNENAYFHVLITKLAEKKNTSIDEMKKMLVLNYGTLARDDDGELIGFKLPAKTKVDLLWPYTKCFKTREENGTLMNFYLVYKRTRDMDTAEMSRLIDGAIWECNQEKIPVDPPEVLARYKEEWSRHK